MPLISSSGSVMTPAFNKSMCASEGGPEAGMLIVPFWFVSLHFRFDRSKTPALVSSGKRPTAAAQKVIEESRIVLAGSG